MLFAVGECGTLTNDDFLATTTVAIGTELFTDFPVLRHGASYSQCRDFSASRHMSNRD